MIKALYWFSKKSRQERKNARKVKKEYDDRWAKIASLQASGEPIVTIGEEFAGDRKSTVMEQMRIGVMCDKTWEVKPIKEQDPEKGKKALATMLAHMRGQPTPDEIAHGSN